MLGPWVSRVDLLMRYTDVRACARFLMRSRHGGPTALVALGLVVTLVAAACGEDEPPPAPATPQPTVEAAAPSPTPEPPTPTAAATVAPTATANPTPTPSPTATPAPTPTPSPSPTATPSPTPTPEPTSEALDASDFDRDRLNEAVLNNPPETVRMTTLARLMPMVEGEIAVTLELVPADEAIRMLMVLGADDQQLSLELIVIGNTQYIRAVDLDGTESPWLASSINPGDPALIDAMGAGNLIDDLIPDDELALIEAVGVEDCGDGRQCFVLTSPEDASVQLLVDTETYLPVAFRGPALGEGFGTDIEMRLEWNAEISISAPADAREVSPDEFALTLAGFFFGGAGISQGPTLPPSTGGQTGTVVEIAAPDGRSALWLELGASPYGEALDELGDLFHGDPGIAQVRYDSTVDIWNWGAGSIELAEATARELFGPDGAFPCGSVDPVVACGADSIGPGPYLLVWSEVLDPVPLDDAAYVRTFWALFQDGDPANDWEALPQFANDVLDASDSHYWIAAIPGGWELRRTFGPQLEPRPTDGAAMILANVVVFWVPVSELGDLDALSLGVASFSGPADDPYGVNGALDKSPEPQQPLTPLDEVGF